MVVLTTRISSASLVALGGETRINATTSGWQQDLDLTALDGGGFAATWRDNDLNAIFVHEYDSNGVVQDDHVFTPFSSANTATYYYEPAITGLADGGFTLTYRERFEDFSVPSSFDTIQSRTITDTDNWSSGLTSRVTNTASFDPEMASTQSGGSITVYTGYTFSVSNGFDYWVEVRLVGADGRTEGNSIRLTSSPAFKDDAAITALSNGGYVVTYESNASVNVIVLKSDGTVLNGPSAVSDGSLVVTGAGRTVALDDGGFVLVWRDVAGLDISVKAQRFDAAGVASGSEMVLLQDAEFSFRPEVALLDDGTLALAWDEAVGSPGFFWDVYTQRFTLDGDAIGSPTMVNTYTDDNQRDARIVALEGGGYVVGWESTGQVDGFDLFSQRYAVNSESTGTHRILGTFENGETLQADVHTLTDANGLGPLNWQWLVDGAEVPGATGTTFQLDSSHVGKTIALRVRYVDNLGVTETVQTADSAPVAQGNEEATGTPVIQGDVRENALLTADVSAISDSDGLGTFSYQWLNNDVAISGANTQTYRPVQSDVGDRLSVRVSFTDGAGNAESVTSAQSATVEMANQATQGAPVIVGTAAENQILTVDTSGMSDPDGLGAFSYQWRNNGVAIANATMSTYTPISSDIGDLLSVQVSYRDGAGNDESVPSAETAAVQNTNDAPTGEVLVSGEATHIGTLTLDASNLADADGLGVFAYQWLRGGVLIDGATGVSYVLSGLDVGEEITARVSYVDGFGTRETVDSDPTPNVVWASQVILGDNGANDLSGGEGDDTISGRGGKDTLTGNGGDDLIEGGNGNDRLIGGAGSDMLKGGKGDDRLEGGDGNDVVTGGKGRDTVFLGNGADRFIDDVQNDRFGADTVRGGKGEDIINGRGGNDRLFGDDGNDTVRGGVGNDELEGGRGDDRLEGGEGNDVVTGGKGRDTVLLGNGADRFIDDTQNDRFGADTVRGGKGGDIINGRGGNDQFFGDDGNDTVRGGLGNDELFGGKGNDQLEGGDGNDVVTGGKGRDTVLLGDGNDRFIDDVQNDEFGADTVRGGKGGDIINGRGGNDQFFGEDGDDTVRGGLGDDTLKGGKGDDRLEGGDGSDMLGGGEGRDTMFGGAGSDTLSGGAGIDFLRGGAGADTFVLNSGSEVDRILDFENGVDIIDLTAFGEINEAEIDIFVNGNDTVVLLNGVRAVLENVDIGLITLDDLDYLTTTDPGFPGGGG